MSFDQIDDQRNCEHRITDCLDFAVTDHHSTKALQKASYRFRRESWCSKREIKQTQEAYLSVMVHLED